MRLINQKSLPYPVDVPYSRVWLQVKDNVISAYNGIQSVELGKYSSKEKALVAMQKLHTQLERLGSITDYRVFRFPEDSEI